MNISLLKAASLKLKHPCSLCTTVHSNISTVDRRRFDIAPVNDPYKLQRLGGREHPFRLLVMLKGIFWGLPLESKNKLLSEKSNFTSHIY